MKRKKFIKTSAALGLSAAILPKLTFSNISSSNTIKIGIIGTGLRGQWVLWLLSKYPEVEISAICDIDDNMIRAAIKILDDAGKKKPKIYKSGNQDYLNLLRKEDLDGVYIATPWRWHARMSIDAMINGKDVGVEVPAAITIEDCWSLIKTSEKTGKFCMIMENVCYRRDVMAILNMVRKGIFGELLHCQGGYQHDLRHVKFNDGKQPYGGGVEFGEKGYSESKWRTEHSISRNGDLYPTHGIGPLSMMLDINRGNRFKYITSSATQSRGLHKYILRHGGSDHPNSKVKFKLGDIVSSIIKCENGQTIFLNHDTNSPRPYSLNFRIQGTEGIWMKDNNSIYLEDVSSDKHLWEKDEKYLIKYDHPIWQRYEKMAIGSGHGGMDFFIVKAFVESIKHNIQPPIDVYDAVSMSVISPLSEESIKNGSVPINFPDFTSGNWKINPPIFGLKGNL